MVYNKEIEPHLLDQSKIASIDLGLNNLAAVTFNQSGLVPFLINGRPLKSINHFFNRQKALFQAIPLLSLSGRVIARSLIRQSIQAILLEKNRCCICY
ncbi:transposase [Nostoc sp. NMS7]|uniref:transposase n=1 Tax=Nostoc sp. NMS7 TaxID=2815391 RepID=UPI0025CDFD7F|nr:transposase [Nostoc sp. NMS7]